MDRRFGRDLATRTGHAPVTAVGDRPEENDSTISVRFDSAPSAAQSARAALAALEPKVEPEVLDDVRLLVSELVTNSVRHSGANGERPVTLSVKVDERRLRVEVSDRGSGFQPRERVPGQSKASGWGLYLVDRLADRWGVVSNHFTRVWFEMDRRAAGSRALAG